MSLVAGERMHVTGVEDKTVVSAASAEVLWIVSAAGVRDTPDLAVDELEGLCRCEDQKPGAFGGSAAQTDRRLAAEVWLESGCGLERVAVVFVEVEVVCTAVFAGGKGEFERCVKNFRRRPRWCLSLSWRC